MSEKKGHFFVKIHVSESESEAISMLETLVFTQNIFYKNKFQKKSMAPQRVKEIEFFDKFL